jgi:hypothetical protein
MRNERVTRRGRMMVSNASQSVPNKRTIPRMPMKSLMVSFRRISSINPLWTQESPAMLQIGLGMESIAWADLTGRQVDQAWEDKSLSP